MHCEKKNKMGNRTLTASVLKTTEGLQNLINHDDGFRFLKTSREVHLLTLNKAKKDFFAMIRQLGAATLFCSFFFCRNKMESLIENYW